MPFQRACISTQGSRRPPRRRSRPRPIPRTVAVPVHRRSDEQGKHQGAEQNSGADPNRAARTGSSVPRKITSSKMAPAPDRQQQQGQSQRVTAAEDQFQQGIAAAGIPTSFTTSQPTNVTTGVTINQPAAARRRAEAGDASPCSQPRMDSVAGRGSGADAEGSTDSARPSGCS